MEEEFKIEHESHENFKLPDDGTIIPEIHFIVCTDNDYYNEIWDMIYERFPSIIGFDRWNRVKYALHGMSPNEEKNEREFVLIQAKELMKSFKPEAVYCIFTERYTRVLGAKK